MDRNLNKVTIGNEKHQEVIDLSRIPSIKRKYRKKQSHFKRSEVRIEKRLYSMYGKRSKDRTNAILNETEGKWFKMPSKERKR